MDEWKSIIVPDWNASSFSLFCFAFNVSLYRLRRWPTRLRPPSLWPWWTPKCPLSLQMARTLPHSSSPSVCESSLYTVHSYSITKIWIEKETSKNAQICIQRQHSVDFYQHIQTVCLSRCAVLYSYKPRRPEELELRKGEMVGVYGIFKEGWLRGLSLRSGKVGILPSNYVSPVLRWEPAIPDCRKWHLD